MMQLVKFSTAASGTTAYPLQKRTHTHTHSLRPLQTENFAFKHLTFYQRKLSKRDFLEPRNMFADFRRPLRIDWTIAFANSSLCLFAVRSFSFSLSVAVSFWQISILRNGSSAAHSWPHQFRLDRRY